VAIRIDKSRSVRRRVSIKVGDVLEAKAERGKVTFTPKAVVDRAIAEALEDIRKGRVCGPFETAEEMLASLKGRSKKQTTKVKKTAHSR